jgi:hypothetical protein
MGVIYSSTDFLGIIHPPLLFESKANPYVRMMGKNSVDWAQLCRLFTNGTRQGPFFNLRNLYDG